MNRTGRYWARMVAGNIAAALVVTVGFSGVSWRTPWPQALEAFGVALLFTVCIAPPVAAVMPRLGPVAWRRFRFPLNWVVTIAVMGVMAAAGSLLAITTLTAVGYIKGGRVFATWFAGSLRISLIMTLTFGILITAYEVMRARLDAATLALRTKERDEAEARRLAAEAQLSSLESRVQPHFLFNTLNSIAALIPDDPGGAERMTGQLASLLRSSLDQQARLVALDEELRVVRDYLDIERVRFGDRLRYTVLMEPDAAPFAVPRLAVQTLVENSVKYAVSPSREGASIAVRAAVNDGRLQVDVEDTGPGFDASALPDGHGLALLRARLAMTFGDRASLRIESAPGRTSVTVQVPTESHIPNPESLP